jgi:predicted ester cyclase
MGLQATGKSIMYDEVIVMRFADRRVAEVWALVDVFSQMQQVGVIPAQRT